MRTWVLWVAIFLVVTCIVPSVSSQPDTDEPVIQDIKVHVIGETWFTVSWTTDEPTRGGVEWGRGRNLGQVQHEGGEVLRLEHHMNVTGLMRGTSYFVRVFASDGSNNTGHSDVWQLDTFPLGMEEWTLEHWGWYIATVVILVSLIVAVVAWNRSKVRTGKGP